MGNKRSDFEDYNFIHNDLDEELDEITDILKKQVNTFREDDNGNNYNVNSSVGKKRKNHKLRRIIYAFLLVISILLIFIITPAGQKTIINILGSYMYGKLDTQPNLSGEIGEETNEKPNNINNVDKPLSFEDVNIMLLGVEEFEGAENTDSMIVASINTKQKTLKLTSLMRDLYVSIPGYSNNKLNAVYSKGGFKLLKETLENDFGITTDEYVLVNFDSLIKVIDILGGIDVTLTANEAHYLNTTNYISNPDNRNVHEGKQLMNGDQVLGYCRVRYVSTGTEINDFGRTQRQRIVLNTIYDKLKSKNLVELGLLMNKILDNTNIETNISESNFKVYLNEVAKLNLDSIDNYRIPSDGSFENQKVDIGKLKRQAVIVPKDWEKIKIEIHDFLYGEEDSTSTTLDKQ